MGEVDLVYSLEELLEQEARSCSMDFGCVTAEYVHRMWGGGAISGDYGRTIRTRKHG